MKRRNHSRFFDDDELEVSDILLQIPNIIFESESRLPFTWGVRRKRSAIDPSLSLATTCANVSSPATPLSFSPRESDGNFKRTKFSYKEKKEDRLKMVDSLTHQRELLKSEIENVTRSYNMLKALNSELKARKQQLNLDKAIAEARVQGGEQVHLQQPPSLLFHHCTQTTSLVSSTVGLDVVNPTSPCVIPDLNVLPEETLGPDLSPTLDLNLNIALNPDNTQLKRAVAAQARKKRLQIYRVKKPKGLSSLTTQTNQFLKLGVTSGVS